MPPFEIMDNYARAADFLQSVLGNIPATMGSRNKRQYNGKTLTTPTKGKRVKEPDLDIGARIRARRKALGLTLTQLQELTGINNGSLSKIERGRQSLTNETIRQLAGAFGISLSELFTDTRLRTAFTTTAIDAAPDASIRDVRAYKKLQDIPERANVAIGILAIRERPEGQGFEAFVDASMTHIFRGAELFGLNSTPEHLAHFKIEDDMMEPRLYCGDVVLVDLDEGAVPPAGGVFALMLDDERVCIRRLLPYPGHGLQILCDNGRYPTITLNGEQARSVMIIGRVKRSHGYNGF